MKTKLIAAIIAALTTIAPAAVIIQEDLGDHKVTVTQEGNLYTYRYEITTGWQFDFSPEIGITVNNVNLEFFNSVEGDMIVAAATAVYGGTVVTADWLKFEMPREPHWDLTFTTEQAPLRGRVMYTSHFTFEGNSGTSGVHYETWIPSTSVPEPSTMLLLAFSTIALTKRRR